MRPLLFVMNPRRIPECIQAIEDLDVDRCWLTGMTEAHLAPYLNEVVAETSYDVYLIVSDDCVPTQDALDAVLALLEQGWPVATGYCNLDEGEYAHVVNLTKSPLVGFPPNERSYDSFTLAEVAAARMPQVKGPEIKERAARLRALGDQVLRQHLADQVGRTHRVLTEGPRLGRTEGFAEVAFASDQPEGSILDVLIQGQDGTRLLA